MRRVLIAALSFFAAIAAADGPEIGDGTHRLPERADDCDVACTVSRSIVERLSAPRFDPFVAAPLPKAASAPSASPPPCVDLRCFEVQGTRWELYSSTDVDLIASLPVEGLWLRRIEPAGAQRSFYLGLKLHQPFVLAPGDLPMIADGELRLAMRRDEIVRESIQFPSVEFETRRDDTDVELHAPLAQIMRDTDGDGLTDLLERQLLLDPARSDSDGDGIGDAADALPNVPFTPADTPRRRAFARLLTRVLNLEAPNSPGLVSLAPTASSFVPHGERTLYLVTDPRDAAGLTSGFRIVVIPPTSLGALRRDATAFGVFYPVTFTLDLDETHGTGKLEYTVALSGGTLTLKFEQGEWSVVSETRWVI